MQLKWLVLTGPLILQVRQWVEGDGNGIPLRSLR